MKKQPVAQVIRKIEFLRVDPKALRQFDPSTKYCTMNCGRHVDDPRSAAERKFLCDDCQPVTKDIKMNTNTEIDLAYIIEWSDGTKSSSHSAIYSIPFEHILNYLLNIEAFIKGDEDNRHRDREFVYKKGLRIVTLTITASYFNTLPKDVIMNIYQMTDQILIK